MSGEATLGPNGWETRRGSLVTDNDGESRRYRVEDGQTSFFDGRMFRSFLELNIPVAGPPLVMRVTSPKDFILFAQSLSLTQGALRVEAFNGASASGTWTALPVIGVNRMAERPSPSYVPAVAVSVGGGFSGGTVSDLVLVRTSAQNAGAQNVGGGTPERGLPAGDYFIRFSTLTGGLAVNDAAQGTFNLFWEERAP
jgi:hypothetical protein